MRSRTGYSVALLMLLTALGLPATSAAHGGDADLSKQPARTLAQQALALLTQKNEVGEAKERVEAALESEDTKDVDMSSIRKASKALENADKDEAVHQLETALAEPKPAEPKKKKDTGEKDAGAEDHAGEEAHTEDGATAEGDHKGPSNAALHKAGRQFKPLTGADEVGAAILGGVLLIVGLSGLLLSRRRES